MTTSVVAAAVAGSTTAEPASEGDTTPPTTAAADPGITTAPSMMPSPAPIETLFRHAGAAPADMVVDSGVDSGVEKPADAGQVPTDITDQITNPLITLSAQRQGGQITVHLHPVELGRIALQVSRRGEGMTVVLRAEHAETARALIQDRAHLEAALDRAGVAGTHRLRIETATVNAGLADATSLGPPQTEAGHDTARHNAMPSADVPRPNTSEHPPSGDPARLQASFQSGLGGGQSGAREDRSGRARHPADGTERAEGADVAVPLSRRALQALLDRARRAVSGLDITA